MIDGEMIDGQGGAYANVEPFPTPSPSAAVSDELNRILTMLRQACPRDSQISFDFDGKLHVHIDVRNREEVALVESMLPAIGLGLFHGITRGGTPHHPFFHRVSALVDR